jgi:SynChlorMet cassette radical SAM/SPASM protein ScmE
MSVTLGGGEPFLRRDLRQLIEALADSGLRFSMVSNGTLINNDWAAFLATTGRCDSVQVSVDGSNNRVHGATRGEGAFDRALAGLRSLQRHGVLVTVRVTITRANVGDLENIAALLLEEMGLPSFSTNSAGFFGSCKGNWDELSLTIADREKAMEKLLDLNRRYDNRITAQAGPLAEARMWLRMERAYLNHEPPFPRGGHLRSCGGVFSKLAVRADGVMVPCNQIPHMELGRINRDSLATVWHMAEGLSALRRHRNTALEGFEFCRGCEYIPYCAGGCPAEAYAWTADADRPSPDSCYRKFLRAGGRLPDSQEDAVLQRTG